MKSDYLDYVLDLEDPVLMREFFLYYLFETCEKLIQLRAFINAKEHKRKRRRWATINNFSDAINILNSQLEKPIVDCQQLIQGKGVDLDTFVFKGILVIKHVLEATLMLHHKLDILTEKSENQITYDFIRKLAVDAPGSLIPPDTWLKFVPSIALTDNYNFIELDLRRVLSEELENYGFEALPHQEENIVLVLPKAESENPLMWPILAHETAHTLIKDYDIQEQIINITQEYWETGKKDKDSTSVYSNWSTEICADIIALRLLGPAYFFSFASMGLLLDPTKVTYYHPSVTNRIGIMASLLKEKFPEWVVNCPDKNISFTEKDLVSFFYILASYKKDLWTDLRYRKYFLPEGSLDIRSSIPIAPSADIDKRLIFELLEKMYVPKTKLVASPQQFEILNQLLKGQPICSQMDMNFDKRSLKSSLYKAKDAKELYSLLPPPEKPLTLATILTCGWLLKVYYNYGEIYKHLKESETFITTQGIYEKRLMRRDALLQNSITRAFMMQLYWKWKEPTVYE